MGRYFRKGKGEGASEEFKRRLLNNFSWVFKYAKLMDEGCLDLYMGEYVVINAEGVADHDSRLITLARRNRDRKDDYCITKVPV